MPLKMNIFCSVFLYFKLYKNKRTNSPLAQAEKTVSKFLPKTGRDSFLRPCAKSKSNIKKWKFGVGVLKQFATTCWVPNFFPSKITPPYCTIQRRSLERQSMALILYKLWLRIQIISSFLQPTRAYVLLHYFYSITVRICRLSDRTVGRPPGPRFLTRDTNNVRAWAFSILIYCGLPMM